MDSVNTLSEGFVSLFDQFIKRTGSLESFVHELGYELDYTELLACLFLCVACEDNSIESLSLPLFCSIYCITLIQTVNAHNSGEIFILLWC